MSTNSDDMDAGFNRAFVKKLVQREITLNMQNLFTLDRAIPQAVWSQYSALEEKVTEQKRIATKAYCHQHLDPLAGKISDALMRLDIKLDADQDMAGYQEFFNECINILAEHHLKQNSSIKSKL